MSYKEFFALIIIGLIASVFAGGGILIGAYFNFITTGVWFL